MLELKPSCENCAKLLPNDSTEAMICTYECTFCTTCVNDILKNVCPNCGGGFEKRPTRPTALLLKNPASTKPHHQPINKETFQLKFDQYKDIAPEKR